MLRLYVLTVWFYNASCNLCKLISKLDINFKCIICIDIRNSVYCSPIRSDKDFS